MDSVVGMYLLCFDRILYVLVVVRVMCFYYLFDMVRKLWFVLLMSFYIYVRVMSIFDMIGCVLCLVFC